MIRFFATLPFLIVISSASDELPRTALFAIPEYATKTTAGGVHLALINEGMIHEVLNRSETEQPPAHQWLKEASLGKQIEVAYLAASKNQEAVAGANVLIGRLEGAGVGPNSSYFTKGDSVVVGSLDKDRVCRVEIKVTISGPWIDGEPMTHGVYFVIPLESVPKDALAVRIDVKPNYKWEAGFDPKNRDTIKPPFYGPLKFSLQNKANGEDGAGQPATRSESK